MNVLGAIGTLMDSTGLKEILGLVYGENAITHMMTGKSVQRAFRGHLLTDKRLNHMILSKMVNDGPDSEFALDFQLVTWHKRLFSRQRPSFG